MYANLGSLCVGPADYLRNDAKGCPWDIMMNISKIAMSDVSLEEVSSLLVTATCK